MNANRRPELIPQTRDLWLLTQQVKQFNHCVEIAIGLIHTPSVGTIDPDVSDIPFGQWMNKVPLSVSHEIGAFSV